jgi:PAS domain S-box-containing protein
VSVNRAGRVEPETVDLRDRQRSLRLQNRVLLKLAKSDSLGRGDLVSALREITEISARILGTERVSVWFFTEDRSKIQCLDLYERSARRHSQGQELAAADYPLYFRALEQDRTIAAHDACSDSRTREFRTSYLTPLGIAAMLDVPVRVEGRMRGVVCHEHVGSARRWMVREQNFAASIGDFVSLAIEASERRRTEQALRRSEKRFRSLIENALDAVEIIDRDGTIVYSSPSLERVMGYTPEEVLGKRAAEYVHPDDLDYLTRIHEFTVAHPGVIQSADLRFRHRNGEWRYLESVAHNLLEDEDVSGIVINFRDVTERKQAERLQQEYSRALEDRVYERTRELKSKNEQLEQTLSQLREAQNQLIIREKLASVGALVAGVAHEVNTPIGAVVSAADLSDRGLNKVFSLIETAESLERLKHESYLQELMGILKENNRVIASAAERVSRIVRSLKNFARLDEAELQWADIHEGIESTLNLIEYELKNKATLIKEYGKIPKMLCYPNELNQLFLNLLRNAVEALDGNGTIRITTRADAGSALIRIADTGRGIPPENLATIFDPAFTRKGMGIGTGLGLSISYSIVQKHKGQIQVESEVGKGTEFTVTLPLSQGSRI